MFEWRVVFIITHNQSVILNTTVTNTVGSKSETTSENVLHFFPNLIYKGFHCKWEFELLNFLVFHLSEHVSAIFKNAFCMNCDKQQKRTHFAICAHCLRDCFWVLSERCVHVKTVLTEHGSILSYFSHFIGLERLNTHTWMCQNARLCKYRRKHSN